MWRDATREAPAVALEKRRSVTPGTGNDYILSDETRDAHNTVLSANGWNLDLVRNHCPALFNHNQDFIIGRWVNIRVENGQLRGRLELAEEDTSPRHNEIRSLVRQGLLRATSVGFRYSKSEPIPGDTRAIRILDPVLREVSLVAVGSNHNAQLAARMLNISDDTMRAVFGKPANEHADAGTAIGKPAATPMSAVASAKAESSQGTRQMPNPTISERVQTAQTEWLTAKAALEQFNETLDNNNITDDQLAKIGEMTNSARAAEQRFNTLHDMERAMGASAVPVRPVGVPVPVAHGNIAVPNGGDRGGVPVANQRPFAKPKENLTAADHYLRALVAGIHARCAKISPYEALALRYGEDGRADPVSMAAIDLSIHRPEGVNALDFLKTRAVTVPATTTLSGWASQLVETNNVGYAGLLIPASVAIPLSNKGLRLNFGRAGVINIPARASTPTVAGAFVLEGNPIPVKQAAFTATPFVPKKMAVISTWTREIGEHSNPTLETLVRDAIQEDTTTALDLVLLDNTAASATRPAGIRAGIGGLTATAGGGFAALVGDIKQLTNALITATNNNVRQMVWIMNPAQALSAALTQNAGGDFPFRAEINNGTLMGYPLIISSNVTAGMVIVIDAADFIWIEGSAPRFDISDQATIVYDDTAPAQIGTTGSPNVVGAPARSLWQTDCIGLRMIFDVNWGLRRSGVVAWTSSVTW